ncbi:hypothetical protein V5O48_012740 [Marasmius crinis-equi]|uniref:Uncharacterized protein n=1 Tax=Marasmius crinis-equi TaxID=585013 RepID=A0ABR3F1Z9_9AGAR
MTRGGKDPWATFTKSVLLSADGIATPVPELQPAVQALFALTTLCEQVTVSRHETRQLCYQCHHLLEGVRRYKPTPSHTLKIAFDDVTTCITRVRDRAATWAGLPWPRALLYLQKIKEDIDESKISVQDCFLQFQPAAADTDRWQSMFAEAARDDHEEMIVYLSEIQHGQEIVREMLRVIVQQGRIKDVKQVMAMMQKSLGELNTERGQHLHSGLSKNLYELQVNAKVLLPNLLLDSGEITDVGARPTDATGALDIFLGQYLRSKKVRAISVFGSKEHMLRRFRREAEVWDKIYDVDKGKYILPVYGLSLTQDTQLYVISPWQENGTALEYVKNNDARIDYRRLVCGR